MIEVAALQIEVDSTALNRGKKDLADFASVAGTVERALGSVADAFLRMATFGAVRGLGDLTNSLKDTVLLAARYETLGVAMDQIGKTAGYTEVDLARYESALEKTGITALQSRESIVKLIAANVDLDKATRLARAAQDLAVVGNMNSSEAFAKMVQGIQTGQVRLLHNMGIMVTFQDAYKKMAAELGKNVTALTDFEKVQARTNAALAYAERLAGAYEAAMGTAGKQLRTMERYVENLRVSLGQTFGPALVVIVSALNDMFQRMADSIALAHASGDFKKWQDTFVSVANAVIATVKVFWDLKEVIGAVLVGYMAMRAYVFVVGVWQSLQAAVAAAQVAMNAYAYATGTVAATAGIADAAVMALNTTITAAGGPIAIAIGIIGALVGGYLLMRDSATEANKAALENIKTAADSTPQFLRLSAELKKSADASKQFGDATQYAKDHQDELIIAKNQIIGLGPEFNNALIVEAKNIEELSAAYNKLVHNQLEEKIKSAEALVKSIKRQMDDLSTPSGFLENLFYDKGTGGGSKARAYADQLKELSKQSADASANLANLQKALKELEDRNKGGMKKPGEEEEDSLKRTNALRDQEHNLKKALLNASKALTDEEKYRHAVASANLDLEERVTKLQEQFASGKIAGGEAALNRLIGGWTRVRNLQVESAKRVYDEAQYKKAEDATKKLADATKKLADVTESLDIIDENGYAKQLIDVEKRFNSFRDTVVDSYSVIISYAQAAAFANGQLFDPEIINLMGQMADILQRVETARGAARLKVAAAVLESDASKLRTALKEAQDRAGYSYTFEEQARAVEDLNNQLHLTPGALAKVKKEIEDQEKRSKSFVGGLKAGFRDFYQTAINVYDNIRQASNRWLGEFSDKLADMVVTGKGSFKDLAQSIIKDLVRIYIQSLLVQAVWKSMNWVGSSGGGSTTYDTSGGGGGFGIDTSGDFFSGSLAGGGVSAPSAKGSGDISVAVSVDARGAASTEVSGPSPEGAKAFGEHMAGITRHVILQELRPGGMLNR